MLKFLKKYHNCKAGNFAIVGAILMSVLMLSIGLAIDTARLYDLRDKFQNGLDLAALNAMQLETDTGHVAAVHDHYSRVLDFGQITAVDVSEDGYFRTLVANASYSYPLSFGNFSVFKILL